MTSPGPVAAVSTSTEAAEAARWLMTPQAVRVQAGKILAAADDDRLAHFRLDRTRLADTADYVAATVRRSYPSLAVPPHSRWRHFVIAGHDRWVAMAAKLDPVDAAERARIRFDLAIVSVLLDAGAGPGWHYRDAATGMQLARSEGLAAASLAMFEKGLFSTDSECPLRVDAQALTDLDAGTLGEHFQVGTDNPLAALDGRSVLINRLGKAIAAQPAIFRDGRLGAFADHLTRLTGDGTLAASDIVIAVLDAFGDIWPGRVSLGGRNLGDTWHHPAVVGPGAASGLVPFHKLSQWLAYSLIEPLVERGVRVVGLDDLTGLAEYRNGGLFIDSGIVVPRDPALLRSVHQPASEPVVEWRALTVALIDVLAPLVRDRLCIDAQRLPLAAVLEGGTWAAGRRLAATLRPGGEPPITIASDGSVF